MLKQAHQKARNVFYVKIKDVDALVKEHSTLYRYTENGSTIQFVANFGVPAVNGYVVQIEGDAPIYMSKAEFDRQYVEAPDA
ncbi:hypothetical protein phiV141_23 [Vibrio phage phiV141]|uniref:Uncharacterized protein n=1 Tax=Vibrio phage phiV141 TaxID=2723905 RepID=A0A7D7EMQ0_9CAUD|nr:hypothetical protein phiV141_23 [Vibrio phage phiV141]